MGGIEEIGRDWLARIDKAGGRVCLQAKRLAGEVRQDPVDRDAAVDVTVKADLLRGNGHRLMRPAATGGRDNAPLGVRLGDCEKRLRVHAKIPKQLSGEPEILARIRR